MRVAAVQFNFVESEPFDARIDRMHRLIAAVSDGADLVVLPELWPNGGFTYRMWDETAQALDGSWLAAMRDAARAASVVLHAGSFIERHEDGSLTNTAVIIEADGTLSGVYRKIHLFGFTEGEPKYLVGGDEVVVADTSIGRLGLSTCYDLRFPELFRKLTEQRSDVFVVPAAWPLARVGHWTVLAQARAIENQTPLIAVNTVGTHGGVAMGGRSIVVSADGTVLAEADDSEVTLRADVDPAATADWRERFPALGDRRL
jgi:predicted amidohydrolase